MRKSDNYQALALIIVAACLTFIGLQLVVMVLEEPKKDKVHEIILDPRLEKQSLQTPTTTETTWVTTSVPTVPVGAVSVPTTQSPAPARPIAKPAPIAKVPAKSPTTTTTTAPVEISATSIVRRTALEIAQDEVGKAGPYTLGGYWCDAFVAWVQEQAGLPVTIINDSPAPTYGAMERAGLISKFPTVGSIVYIDLLGKNNEYGFVTHMGIVERVDGNTIYTIEGNADSSGVVVRKTRTIGDGYVIGFGPL